VTLKSFFEGARDGRLTAVKCTACGELAIPPKQFCPACGKRGWQAELLSGGGTIASYTVIRVAPRKFAAEAPYALAQVRLNEGVSILGRIVDVPLDRLAIGLEVKFRPLVRGDQTGIAFGPA
jgi:uncharacterized OB-fold protein